MLISSYTFPPFKWGAVKFGNKYYRATLPSLVTLIHGDLKGWRRKRKWRAMTISWWYTICVIGTMSLHNNLVSLQLFFQRCPEGLKPVINTSICCKTMTWTISIIKIILSFPLLIVRMALQVVGALPFYRGQGSGKKTRWDAPWKIQ